MYLVTKISSKFRGISRVFVRDFADLLEIRSSTTARNIRSPDMYRAQLVHQQYKCQTDVYDLYNYKQSHDNQLF